MSLLSWRAWQAHANGAMLQRTTKVLLKRPYLHAAGASLHQPKYSLKRCNLHVAFASSHRGRRCPSFLASHECDNQDKQVGALTALQPATKVLLKQPYLHAAGSSFHQPKYSIKRGNLHVAFALDIMGVEFHLWSSSHAHDKQLTPPARSTGHQLKYSFNGPIHDACEEEKDGHRRPLRPLLASWDWNLVVSLQLGRLSPKPISIASSSNPFATIYIRMVTLWIWVRLQVWSLSSSVQW